MLTDRELQSLRNLGNESEAAADEIVDLRAELDYKTKMLANARIVMEIARQIQADMKAQGVLLEWQTLLEDALVR